MEGLFFFFFPPELFLLTMLLFFVPETREVVRMHVHIAWQIYHHQQKVKVSLAFLVLEGEVGNGCVIAQSRKH